MQVLKGKRSTVIVVAVALNVILIVCTILSVLSAFNNAEAASFSQNIENIRTLTNASANKVELEFSLLTKEVLRVSRYVNQYNDVGMTQEELYDFFDVYYASHTWELADSQLNELTGTNRGFSAVELNSEERHAFAYRTQAYPELAKIFAAASGDTMDVVYYTSEFTDSSPALTKVSAITTTIRVREEATYQYKTLMLLIESSETNHLISDNNDINTLNYFDYSNIILDDSGNYVISNSQFQGTNFADYVALYNETFSPEDAKSLSAKLGVEDYSDVLYYKNNRGQDCAYTIVPVQNSNWHVLSIVPLESFHNSYDFHDSFLNFAFFFGLMFLIDIVFVLLVNHQLRHITREAQAASLAKSEFLSSMSHDIRTPMNAIIGMTVLADESLKEQQPDLESLKDCVKTIQLSGNHLLTLINDILDISKIENGKVVLAPDDFSIAESIEKMLEIVQPQMKEKNFTFETHIVNVNHEFVHADELRIHQVYLNILSNAIKYTNPGGTITVDFMEESIPGCDNMARFIYRVSDTGIGMDPEFLKTIFDRFSRAIDTRVNTTQGTGLGMAISKQLIDLMGGTIQVESELDVGSTFTVTLALPVGDARVDQISLQGLRVLLIDDDPILLETAKITLDKAGVAVDSAQKGYEGVQMALARRQQDAPYDVILVDWKMSSMDGIHVIHELRRAPGGDEKIVVMTAYNVADIEAEARAAKVNGFITKPLFQSKLLHAIQSLFAEEESETEQPARKSFDLTLLVAEDNNTNWRVLNKILAHYGIHADRAENGEKAVNAIAGGSRRYDLVLMDIQMPVMNGYDATKAIRSLGNPQLASVPIYAMTADTFAEDVARCLASGMNGHLAKPIEVDKLMKVLEQISGKRSERNGQK